ncbi:MAG: proton-conducting transporter membrane subunit, partial [Syntrophobacteraceae bacterium]
LLWMSAGAVLAMAGRGKCTELGGLHKTMPWTLALGLIGALAISSFPGTSGFTSKSMIIQAAADSHLTWVLFILEVASAGVFLHAGIKFPYFVFFAKDQGLRPPEAPRHMLFAMSIPAFLCIYLGIHPEPLYAILPYDVGGFNVYKAGKVVAQLQLLMFSALTFFLLLPMLKRTDTIALELDWFYRKGGRVLYSSFDYLLNNLNDKAAAVGGRLVKVLLETLRRVPALVMAVVTLPGQIDGRVRGAISSEKIRIMDEALLSGTLPVGATLLSVVFGLAVLLLMVL